MNTNKFSGAVFLFTTLSCFSSTAFAEGFSVGAGFEMVQYSNDFDTSDLDFNALKLVGEYNFTNNFVVGVEVSKGTNTDDIPLLSTTVSQSATAELDNVYGFYGLYSVPVADRVDLFARGGYTVFTGSVDSDNRNLKNSLDQEGITLGLGVNIAISDNVSLRLGYTHVEFSDNNEFMKSGTQSSFNVIYKL